MGFTTKTKQYFAPVFLLLIAVSATVLAAPPSTPSAITIENNSGLGTIKGVVRDAGGSPIADATVAIFRTGTSKLLKQVTSSRDGSFLARILPGTYTVLAVAQGFNPVTLLGVEVPRATEVNYGFKLERSGSGNTLPEKRLDRSSSKWRIRASQSQRSIYQNRDGKDPVAEAETIAETDEPSEEAPEKRRGQTVIETYFAGSRQGNSVGVNFATLVPVSRDMEIVFAGQVGKGKNSPQRFETALKFRPSDDHQIRVNGSMARLGNFTAGLEDKVLGQLSFQASDEWKIRDGVILVLGFDYSRFTGAGSDSSLTPRLGLQYDINSKTRFQTAYTAQTEQKTWAHALDLEGMSVGFTEPVAIDDFVVIERKPMMNKSRRFEFGVERILDNNSSIEANVFFDTTLGRGVGLNNFSFDALGDDGLGDFVANQQGRSSGVRVVYSRRINGIFSTAAGYSFGNGQKLSASAISDPASAFESDFFNSFFAQLVADLKTGTHVKTVFRLSPQATVFAIDPFRGRLAIYDPGLSVLVTQSLPTLGLPIRAQAIVDARNLFDFHAGIFGEESGIRLNSQGRMFRGGIQVRF